VTADLRGALIAPTTKHRAANTRPKRLGEILAAIYGWTKGQETTVAGLKLLALLALRPGELRAATWDEIDLEAGGLDRSSQPNQDAPTTPHAPALTGRGHLAGVARRHLKRDQFLCVSGDRLG